MNFKILCVVLFVVLLPLTLLAEESGPKHGVLPDGTPFRIDAEGNQIVDYIAELENAIDNLNRRIYGLEVDLRQKDAQLSKAGVGTATEVAARNDVEERDLPVGAVDDPTFYGHSPQNTVPAEGTVIAPTLGNDLHEQDQKHLDEEQQLERDRQNLQRDREALMREHEALEKERQAMQAGLQKREQAIVASAKGSQDARELLAQRNDELMRKDAEVEALRIQVNTLREDYEVLKTQLSTRDAELARVNRELEEARTESAKAVVHTAPSQTAQNRNSDRNLGRHEEPMATFSPQRMQALESAKSMMRTELTQVKSLVVKRDNLFTKFEKNATTRIKFGLSDLRASDGTHLSSIGEAIDDAGKMSELARTKKEIAEIRAEVSDDIALIDRMSRVR